MKKSTPLWESQNQNRNFILESIFRRHIRHANVVSVTNMGFHYEIRIIPKWYSIFTFGFLKGSIEKQIYYIWYQLDVTPINLNVILE